MSLADCFLRAGKIFTQAERDDIAATAKTHVEDGMSVEEAERQAVTDHLKEAQSDLKEVTDEVAKIQGEATKAELKRMGGEAGWAERGGKLIREQEGQEGIIGGTGKVVGRTKWIPNAEWFQRMRQDLGNKGLSDEAQIQNAVDAYLQGDHLNPNAKRTIDWMTKEAQFAIADSPEPGGWDTMSEGEKNAELDAIFGEDTSLEKAGATATSPEVGFSLKGQTAEEARSAAVTQEREAAEARAREAAPPSEDFALTGSNRLADEAVARGQQELAPVQESAAFTQREQPPSSERPYAATPLKELQRLARETEDDAQLRQVEDELNTRSEEKARLRDERLAQARQAKAVEKPVVTAPRATTKESAEAVEMRKTLDDLAAQGFQQNVSSYITGTPAFQAWFGNSKVVDAEGKPLVVYHGTGRPDRIGNRFRKDRATSGPMAYFTNDPQIASNYAAGKQDTSLSGEELAYENWFQFTPKGASSPQSIVQKWWGLTSEQRTHFNDMLRRIHQNEDTGVMEDGGERGGISPDTYDWNLKEAHGNGIRAAIELWLNSGSLFDQEEEFLKTLKLAGLDTKGIDFIPQNETMAAVYPVYLSIQNPLVTNAIPDGIVNLLDSASRRTRLRHSPDAIGTDPWAKQIRYSPSEWISTLKEDIAAGKNSYVWTSIPDWVTKTLQTNGYDGVQDVGGKMGGEGHDVWVPFEERQIKSSLGNRGTFDPSKRNILQQQKPAYDAGDAYSIPQTRPATPEQKSLGVAALRALFSGDRRAGATLLGSALWQDFKERAGSELIGKQVGSPQELALAAQILRDPRFETMRVFFTNGDKIVGHTGWTSRLPGAVAFSMDAQGGPARRINNLRYQMTQAGADGYYLMHNHPSGRATPSGNDVMITHMVSEQMPGFKGHVIIDHNEFGLITNDKTETHKFEGSENQPAELPHDQLGKVINAPGRLAEVGKMLQAPEGYSTLIATNSQGQIQALADIPEHLLLGGSEIKDLRALTRIRRFMDMTGSAGGAFLVAKNPGRFDWLLAKGGLTDAVSFDGGESRASNPDTVRASMARGRSKMVLPMEQMKFAQQTDTPAFQAWFGDSKVVDAEGKPLVVYHGTTKDFSAFDTQRSRPSAANPAWSGDVGSWFSGESKHKGNYDEGNAEFVAQDYTINPRGKIGGPDEFKEGANVMPVFLSIKNPMEFESWEHFDEFRLDEYRGKTGRQFREGLISEGHDGMVIRNSMTDGNVDRDDWVAFRPEQIKSAIGNRGTFDPNSPNILKQDSPIYAVHSNALDSARKMFNNVTRSDRVLNRLISKFNTPFHIAETHPEFKPVYDEAQDFNQDVSRVANEAADRAPDLLPRIESFSDFAKQAPSNDDIAATADALYAGTLFGGGSPLEGRAWTDDELKSGRAVDANGVSVPAFNPLNDSQVKLYRQALASVAHSLTEQSKSLVWRLANQKGIKLSSAMTLPDMVRVANNMADQQIEGKQFALQEKTKLGEENAMVSLKNEIAELQAFKEELADIEDKTGQLIEHGYFPAMRFGTYAVTAQSKDANGNWDTHYFGRFETQTAANLAKDELTREFPQAQVTSGVMNEDVHKLFAGLNLDALELFAQHMQDEQGNSVSADPIMQQYFRMAVAERSTLKRQIHRKGTPGFSRDVPRALAQFTVANATATSRNYHAANMLERVQHIKAGDLQAYATRYVRYLQDPQEESQALRGFLANYYILGSIAFGAVNMTQPLLMTAPYLSQTTSWADSMGKLAGAMKDYAYGLKNLTPDERQAYEKAQKAGIVSPQEIHQIRAESRASMMGDSPLWNRLESALGAKGINLPGKLLMRKAAFVWGSIYSITEQWNRGTTFLAAYRIAKEKGLDAYEFAKKTVDATQGVYNRANRPQVSRGTIGSLVMTFKQFNISYLELAKRLYSADKKAFAVLMLTLMALAGTEGLPFAEDIEDLIDTIGQWMGYPTNAKKALRKKAFSLLGPELGDMLLHGASAIPGVPIDVANRMGMHNIIPGSAMLKTSEPDKTRDILEILGPAAAIFQNAGKAVTGLATGRPGDATAMLPSALQNVLKASEMVDTGTYRDSMGRKVMDVGAADAFAKLVGFQPAKIASESRIVSQNQQDIALHKVIEDSIAGKWARGLADKDPAMVAEAIQQWSQWNRENKDFPIAITGSQIQRRIRELQMSREERFLKSAPKEIRQGVRQDIRP